MQYEYGEQIPGTDVFVQVTRLDPVPGTSLTDFHAGRWAFELTAQVPGGLTLYRDTDFSALADFPLTHAQIAKIAFNMQS